MLQSCVVQHHLKPEKLQNRSNEEKGKDKKKEKGEGKEDKKKKENNCCTPSFSNSYFGEVETSFHTKGPFGDNVIKNPARKTLEYI